MKATIKRFLGPFPQGDDLELDPVLVIPEANAGHELKLIFYAEEMDFKEVVALDPEAAADLLDLLITRAGRRALWDLQDVVFRRLAEYNAGQGRGGTEEPT